VTYLRLPNKPHVVAAASDLLEKLQAVVDLYLQGSNARLAAADAGVVHPTVQQDVQQQQLRDAESRAASPLAAFNAVVMSLATFNAVVMPELIAPSLEQAEAGAGAARAPRRKLVRKQIIISDDS
jgi:uncharacterized protein (DUF885 family)